MRFVVDECAGPRVARWLRDQGHDVYSVFDEASGLDDDNILQRAFDESRILVTHDKGFGDKVFREKRPHRGIVLLRLDDETSAMKIELLRRLLDQHAALLENRFTVVAESGVRFASG